MTSNEWKDAVRRVPYWATSLVITLVQLLAIFLQRSLREAGLLTSVAVLSLSSMALTATGLLGLAWLWRKRPDDDRIHLGRNAIITLIEAVSVALIFATVMR